LTSKEEEEEEEEEEESDISKAVTIVAMVRATVEKLAVKTTR
jgi:hypothetical protein